MATNDSGSKPEIAPSDLERRLREALQTPGSEACEPLPGFVQRLMSQVYAEILLRHTVGFASTFFVSRFWEPLLELLSVSNWSPRAGEEENE